MGSQIYKSSPVYILYLFTISTILQYIKEEQEEEEKEETRPDLTISSHRLRSQQK
jgi:hypothetical protein